MSIYKGNNCIAGTGSNEKELSQKVSNLENNLNKLIVPFDNLAENDWFAYGQGNSNTNACKMILNLDIDLNDKLFRVNSDKNTMLYLGAKKSDGTEGIFYIGGGIGNGELIAITTNQKFKSVTVCRIYVGQFVTFTFNDDGTYKSHTSKTPVPTSDVITKTNTISFTPTGDYNPATKKYVDDAIAALKEELTGSTT